MTAVSHAALIENCRLGKRPRPVSLPQRMRSSTRAWARWRASRNASCPTPVSVARHRTPPTRWPVAVQVDQSQAHRQTLPRPRAIEFPRSSSRPVVRCSQVDRVSRWRLASGQRFGPPDHEARMRRPFTPRPLCPGLGKPLTTCRASSHMPRVGRSPGLRLHPRVEKSESNAVPKPSGADLPRAYCGRLDARRTSCRRPTMRRVGCRPDRSRRPHPLLEHRSAPMI